MEQLNLQNYQPRKQTRYDLIVEIAGKLNKPIGQMLGLTRGWTHEGLDNIYRSSLALVKDSKDKEMNFSKAFWWHMKEVKKQL